MTTIRGGNHGQISRDLSPYGRRLKHALKEVNATGYITRFDWGCMDGDYTGWVVLEAESATQALMVVPSLQRNSAKAVKLVKFSPADVATMH
ncbi:MAG: hypothetical protein NTU47_01135 [Ignavibacteriales bacterium]|nr:hypothetical protein [Ignavibacteriales bacterium]